MEEIVKGSICDHETTKLVMEQMVFESGAKIIYGTYVIGASDNLTKQSQSSPRLAAGDECDST